jgi:Mg/Co/Ni transporter MgtE
MQECKLKGLLVKDIELDNKILPAKSNQPIDEILSRYDKHETTSSVYVTDSDDCLVGKIDLKNMLERFFPILALRAKSGEFRKGWVPTAKVDSVEDIMDKTPVFVFSDSLLEDALTLMIKNQMTELPVLDGKRRLTGFLDVGKIISRFFPAKNNC